MFFICIVFLIQGSFDGWIRFENIILGSFDGRQISSKQFTPNGLCGKFPSNDIKTIILSNQSQTNCFDSIWRSSNEIKTICLERIWRQTITTNILNTFSIHKQYIHICFDFIWRKMNFKQIVLIWFDGSSDENKTI